MTREREPLPTRADAAVRAVFAAFPGAHFVLCGPREGKADQAKFPHGPWREVYRTVKECEAHLARGCLLGIVPASVGAIVVDVDAGGKAACEAVCALLGTPAGVTLSRSEVGRHVWFRAPGAVVPNRNKWRLPEGEGDVRGSNGYVVLWDLAGFVDVVRALAAGSGTVANLSLLPAARERTVPRAVEPVEAHAGGEPWAALMPRVAEALLGTPRRRFGADWRYGTHGSLSVDVEKGVWTDHEAGTDGGVLDLVMRELGGGKAAALEWLERRGWLPARGAPGRRPNPAPAGENRRTRFDSEAVSGGALDPDTPLGGDATVVAARRVWDASVRADATPARVYLAARMAWPPVGTGPDLPESVRWLPADAAPPKDPAGMWYGLPPGAAGAVVFAWRIEAGAAGAGDTLAAVSLEALDELGRRPDQAEAGKRWRRTCGRQGGTVFTARTGTDAVHLTEGEVSALALCHVPDTGPGRILACGGAGALARIATALGGPVVLHADGDVPGRGAAERARHALAASGREACVRWCAPGTDPADELAVWHGERAGRRMESGEAREDADRGAWMDLFRVTEGNDDGN